MIRISIVAGLALAVVGCGATPKNGEVMEGDVRMQPVAVATDGGAARCTARALLMNRSRSKPKWEATVEAPATVHLPRNARVVELVCAPVGGGPATARYLTSQESSEAKQGQAATGAMFLLLGGLPALATGMAQRTDVYEFPATATVSLAPPASAGPADRKAFADRRAAEIEQDMEAWHKLRWALCEAEQSPGSSALDDHCQRDLDDLKRRREQLTAEVRAMKTAQN
jgi:hypothetical protein